MGRIRTNIMELLLKEVLIGKSFYDNQNNLATIDDLNYQPLTNTVFIRSGENGYRLSINDVYDFDIADLDDTDRIFPNKGKLISDRSKPK
jgi:hypothetical protein